MAPERTFRPAEHFISRAVFTLWWFFFACAVQASEKVPLDLPGGPLDEVLLAFGRQTDVSVVFGQEAVSGHVVTPLAGRFTPEDAVVRLLSGACLTAEWVRPRLVAIRADCPEDSPDTSPIAIPTPLPSLPVSELPDAQPLLEEMVVLERRTTGSRLAPHGVALPVNIQVIDRPDIEFSGQQTVSRLLRYVPSIAGNSTSTLVTNGGDGSATVTLRGLPASNTLVLLNGRRINPEAYFGEAVDLNSIPLAVVERIEILKDGASAVYGSDAVAGVVNVQTRKKISGLLADVYVGRSEQGGLETEHASLLHGHQGDRLKWVTGVSWYRQGALYSRERALSASSDERRRGSTDRRSSAIAPAWIGLETGPVVLADANDDGLSPGDFRSITDEDRFEFRDYTSLIVPTRRASLFLDASWQLQDTVEAFIETQATDYRATNQLAPAPIFTAFERIPLQLDAAHPLNPFDMDIFDLRRRLVELGPRKQHNRSRTVRAVAGLTGSAGQLTWDASLLHARTDARERFTGSADTSRVAAALGADCSSPCVPLNVVGPVGSINSQMLDWISVDARSRGESRLRSAMLNLYYPFLDLPAGPVDVAMGAEYREETLSSQPDDVLAKGLLLGSSSFTPTDGRRTIWEAYVESRLPLVKDLPGIHRLDLYLAGRYSVYNDFGRETNPRIVIHYQPTASLGVRASYSESFRAPNLYQLFSGPASDFEQLNDPCALPANVGLLPGCIIQSDPSLDQFVVITGGNEELDPERSRTLSLALEWSRSWNRIEASGAVDFFRIFQRDVVDSQSQFIINEQAAGRGFDDRIIRDAAGNITRVIATPINIGTRDVSGIDIEADARLTMKRTGTLSVSLHATHIAQFEDRLTPELPAVEVAGTFTDSAAGGLGALPDWKLSLAIRWQRGFWQAQFDTFLVAGVRELMPLTLTRRSFETWAIHNTQIGYAGPMTKNFKVSLGINNLLNEPPPWSSAAFNDSYDSRTYDPTGRFTYLRMERTF